MQHIKSDDPVHDFLQREKAMLAMEDLAIAAQPAAPRRPSAQPSPKADPARQSKPTDWQQVEKYLMGPEGNRLLDIEACNSSPEFAFLRASYDLSEPDSEYWREARKATQERMAKDRDENAKAIAEARKRAAAFITQIEAEEIAAYDEQQRRKREFALLFDFVGISRSAKKSGREAGS